MYSCGESGLHPIYPSRKLIMKWLATLFFIFGSAVAHADGGKSSADNPKWKEECGSCHIAYPPRFLTADDWQELMGGLDKHFGANATLDDPKDSKEILDFLRRHAGFRKKNSASSLRISDTPWFIHEHREISGNTWSDPAVKSRANCVACHVNAERGDWSEHGVRVPGGQGWEEHDDD